jgi:transcriptional regulator with XRE-family HTH domain
MGTPERHVSTTVHPESRGRLSSDVEVPRLREWRIRRALSQEELAHRARVSRTTVIKLEGGRDAWPQTVRKLATALRVDPEDLQG